MYPTVVVVLVETRRSMTDICELGASAADPLESEARAATSNPLAFGFGTSLTMPEITNPTFRDLTIFRTKRGGNTTGRRSETSHHSERRSVDVENDFA